jgi:hypothetical protein
MTGEKFMAQQQPLTRDEEWKYAEKAMTWYGWGSPVGLGIMLVCLALAGLIVRLAITGL